jgi:pilus assembly protein CpaF
MILKITRLDKSVLLEEPLQDNKVLQIGRNENCDIVLQGKTVSRLHARIQCEGGFVFVEDAGSSAGTKVNGTPIQERVLVAAGDTATIGDFALNFMDVNVPVPPLPKPAAPKPVPAAPAAQKSDGKSSPSKSKIPDFIKEFQELEVLYTDEVMVFKNRIHTYVLEKLNLPETAMKEIASEEMQSKLEICLDQTMRDLWHELPSDIPSDMLRQAMIDELMGFGPISPLLRSKLISEVMVNGPNRVFIESKGKLYETGVRFFNAQHLIAIIQRIVEPLGRHVDAASPMVDARLPDGSRVNAIIPPLALDGSSMTIRKFSDKKLTTDDLIEYGSVTKEMALFLEEAVRSRQNILVSGGTGSGKTTLLNILSQFIPSGERIITVEDSAELKLSHRNIVRLEARPANIEGQGRVTIRELVINTLRMRPDRIIVGECRGAEALDMLQAMNTGHDGSMTTCHANNPRDALSRLENMVMMAGFELPSVAIREQIASAVNLVVQQTRMPDGSRKVIKITEVAGREASTILLQDIFTYEQEGFDTEGKVRGYHAPTGNIPHFVEELRASGDLQLDMGVFVPHN